MTTRAMSHDVNGLAIDKGDKVSIRDHYNEEINGDNYFILRRWELKVDHIECLREINGVVQHVVVDRKYIVKGS
jgi:hypothetical protein